MAEEVKVEGVKSEGDKEIKEENHETTGVNTDSKTWEEQVNDAYTDLVAELQEACENHIQKVRGQLKNMVKNASDKADGRMKSLFVPEEPQNPTYCEKGTKKESQRIAATAIVISYLLLFSAVVHLTYRVDRAADSSENAISVFEAIVAHGKLESISYRVDEITKVLSRISYEIKKMKRDINPQVSMKENTSEKNEK